MKISLVGRMFIVTHYDGSRVTVSNSEFDGQTTTSASCNGDHYWTMMFYGKGDRVTLDRNYYHDVSGRAPKLGQDGTTGTFQATNNYFKNMQGHAFDIYSGATALIEGNVFETVKNPFTSSSSNKGTVYNVPDSAAASACSSALGRACEVNKASGSGALLSLKTTSALSTLAKSKSFLVKPVAASQVSSIISSSVGPTRLKARSIRGRWVRY
ncbi:Kinase [Verticillium dahliae VDG1]|nr:Kinase [Verticillium dahliae VDG1]